MIQGDGQGQRFSAGNTGNTEIASRLAAKHGSCDGECDLYPDLDGVRDANWAHKTPKTAELDSRQGGTNRAEKRDVVW
jgi:hypothetical protein